MAIGGDGDGDAVDGGDGDANLVQHPLHVHWRLGNREQRHWTWQGPRSLADWYFDSWIISQPPRAVASFKSGHELSRRRGIKSLSSLPLFFLQSPEETLCDYIVTT